MIKISDICLSKSKYNKKQQRIIISTMLTMINLSLRRGNVVEIKIKGLGTIHTHRNRKKIVLKKKRKKSIKIESILF